MRIAIVHDWLYVRGGAEKVLQSLLKLYPQADVFTLFDLLPDADRAILGYAKSTTSFINRLPLLRRLHRTYLPLMPLAVEQFDLSGYDLIISSSYAVAKGVLTGPDQLHISYVHSPMRYAWDLQHQYLRESRMDRGLKSVMARVLLSGMRLWDSRTAAGVDHYVANSRFIGRRIRKIYGRAADVIHPPVDVPVTLLPVERGEHYFTASRLVPYKNVANIVAAFRNLPDRKLIVAGTGPELARIRKIAGPNVEIRGHVDDVTLRTLMRTARAFVFAAEEDFGIVPVEAQGEGTPVIALGRGGARETVIPPGVAGEAPTGILFDRPTPQAIADAVRQFELIEGRILPEACHLNALRFARSRFEAQFSSLVATKFADFQIEIRGGLKPSLHSVSQAEAA